MCQPCIYRFDKVLVGRDPREVAQSLLMKKRIPIEHSLRLWELYNQSLLAATEGARRIVVRFEGLMQHTARELERLRQFVASEALVSEAALQRAVDARLEHAKAAPGLPLTPAQQALLEQFNT